MCDKIIEIGIELGGFLVCSYLLFYKSWLKSMGKEIAKLSTIEDLTRIEQSVKKEFNEIMFGSPPLKNKVVIVRSIKDYDYSAYRKDIDALNEYLKDGWSIVNHETNEFVHTYILGKPLVWCKENGGDGDDE